VKNKINENNERTIRVSLQQIAAAERPSLRVFTKIIIE
jgi:hypothetical protein